ncbi:protein transport protein Sec31A-like protein [Leptotrombidium deliense]|uniref:Protein transport protein Sec31A-like protein n=1 Tax=Leptotrombidium deliense TaxID=299467 RepID=A0A443RZ98_9ACAR|nr:protein transport protein Sec31A-like protein [Leptotrombidium deliense]
MQAQLSMNMRRKLEDIRCKMENLRLKLSKEGQLSSLTMNGLKDIISAINAGDYNRATSLHTHLVATTTFGETADFLPAIKVLVHLAHQHL